MPALLVGATARLIAASTRRVRGSGFGTWRSIISTSSESLYHVVQRRDRAELHNGRSVTCSMAVVAERRRDLCGGAEIATFDPVHPRGLSVDPARRFVSDI